MLLFFNRLIVVYKDIFFKRIFRTAAANIISNRFNKIYKKNSKLAIDFEILYEDDETVST